MRPQITANSVFEHSSGAWLLPFWRQKPRHIFVTDRVTNATTRRCVGAKGAGRQTSSAVLVSRDRGRNWEAHGKLLNKTAGWLIENTLVERANGNLWMLFRTKAGVVFGCESGDMGRTWGELPQCAGPCAHASFYILTPSSSHASTCTHVFSEHVPPE